MMINKNRTIKLSFKQLLTPLLIFALFIILIQNNILSANAQNMQDSSVNANDLLNVNTNERIEDGTILHAFCWSFHTIKENMKDIADAGFTSIQTSPINEINSDYSNMKLMGSDTSNGTDGAWWWHYQPTDWKIGNYQLGTRDEFIAMCKKADEYNIKIIVDVVPNHTANNTEKVSKNLINACNGNLYHDTGFTAVSNWSDRLQCTRYSLISLPDVNTEDSGFQDYFISYLNDCIACGADGFRYDTAKHIGLPDDDRPYGVVNNFWTRVTSEIRNASEIFNYGEVLQGGNERISEYIKVIGSTTASSYGYQIRNAINGNNLSVSNIINYQVGDVDTSKLVTWVESHDNYINDGTWQQFDDTKIKLAWAVITARKDGVPLFFDRPYGSSTNNKWGSNTIGIAGSDIYKDDEIAAVNKFRNAMIGESENLINPNNNSQVLMIERGTKGAVLVNTSYNDVTVNTSTNLADAAYNSITDDQTMYYVTNGKLSGTIPSRSVSVLMKDSEYGSKLYIENFKAYFTSDTCDIILRAKDITNATYQINNGTSKSFSDGDTITIGKGDAYNTSYTLVLSGNDTNGEKYSKEYTLIKKEPGKENTVYFQKPTSWSNNIYAYVYDESESSVKEIAPWPGEAMKINENGVYSYSFEEEYEEPLIIFNDGTNQAPGSQEQGFLLIDGGTYSIDGLITNQENEITIYYYSSWSGANIHYKIGNKDWTSVPGIKMKDSKINGYKVVTIDMAGEKTLTVCFNNGNGSWDNNNGNNYYINNTGIYTIKNGTITNGIP
ncbi:alpha-amylase [Lachnotalea glycerini]|uniref:Alpha-amylase n=1 Tax=Lachnotalea glycerini TaxID=1763509 RepID=A0A318EXP2_9FIRM|nr:starch-binding protein [Lachnotalea glycerini]PXV95836.1 alpha-amylase [Lachnotalea glycerini]